jgi:hypothetical protein
MNSRVGDRLEVVDKNEISQIRVAAVKEIVGKRLHVEYLDSSADDEGNYSNYLLVN